MFRKIGDNELEYIPSHCECDGCNEKVQIGKSYCETHYKRMYYILEVDEDDSIVDVLKDIHIEYD